MAPAAVIHACAPPNILQQICLTKRNCKSQEASVASCHHIAGQARWMNPTTTQPLPTQNLLNAFAFAFASAIAGQARWMNPTVPKAEHTAAHMPPSQLQVPRSFCCLMLSHLQVRPAG
jgi:hypothetical protein